MDDARAFVASDLRLEASDAGAIVGAAQRFAERIEIDVEMGFTHVDADIHWFRASVWIKPCIRDWLSIICSEQVRRIDGPSSPAGLC